MEISKNFSLMNAEELRNSNGGGFAYDVGRFLRYIALGGTTSYPLNAYADFVYNEIVNDIVNE